MYMYRYLGKYINILTNFYQFWPLQSQQVSIKIVEMHFMHNLLICYFCVYI